MPQAVWTGRLSFGLVSIPVKLYSATAPKDVRFHQYDARSGRRIRYRRVATGPAPEHAPPPTPEHAPPSSGSVVPEPAPSPVDPEPPAPASPAPADLGDEPEVEWEEIVRGFEVQPGRVVTVTADDLASVAPERSRELEVERFVPLADIDPVYLEKSYYVVPQPAVGAERPYWLLYRAMEAAAKVAVGRFVLRSKEHLAVVRPSEHLLMLETLFYADEVRDPKELWILPTEEPPEREQSMARQLIEALVGTWDPERHRDEYRERLLDLLRSKAGEARVAPQPEVETASPIADLMEALEASVEAAKEARARQRRQTG